MATIKPVDGGKHAGPSARDLTPYQWRAAKFAGNASSGDSAQVENGQQIDVAGAGDRVEGVIQYPGDAAGRPTTILTLGRQKIKAGEALQAGDKIKSGALGVAMKAAPGEEYFGSVIEAVPPGALVPFEFDRGRQPAV